MIEATKLENIVGPDNVISSQQILKEYSQDISFVKPVLPKCVVKPACADEIEKLVRLANDTATPLIPVSSKSPHFKGDTVPGIGGAVIVDLSEMKKIIRVDRTYRSVLVEPGVTYGELMPILAEKGLRIISPLAPRKTKSVVGSLIDREPPTLPAYHWDIADPLDCVEIVFGTGDTFRTGSAAGPGTLEEQWESSQSQKEAAGPSSLSLYRVIQGAQGTMGIVTWASIRVEVLPSLEKPFVVGSGNLEKLQELAYWLVRRKLVNECFIVNNVNFASIMADKWPADYYQLKNSLPEWILFINMAGYEYLPGERVKYQANEMLKLAKGLSLKPEDSILGFNASDILSNIRKPSEDPYWKLRYKGSCQDITFLSMYEHIPGYINVMRETASESDFPVNDIGIYLQQIVQGCNWHCEFTLPYQATNPDECKLVEDISNTVHKRLLSEGAFFSRPYGENAPLILNRDAATVEGLRKVKNIVDPNNIMNPGKLCF